MVKLIVPTQAQVSALKDLKIHHGEPLLDTLSIDGTMTVYFAFVIASILASGKTFVRQKDLASDRPH